MKKGDYLGKDIKRKAKKIIKFRHDSSMFYKFDKYLKISKIKINNIEPMKNIENGKVYKINYKHGFNLWNPITQLIIIFYLLVYVVVDLEEIFDSFKSKDFSETFKIKD